MKSMTGYGRAQIATPHYKIGVRIRAVNSKLGEYRFHLDPVYFELESLFRSELSKKVLRGNVDVMVERVRARSGHDKTRKSPTLEKWNELKSVAKLVGYRGEIPFHLLFHESDFLSTSANESSVSSQEKQHLMVAFQSALSDLLKEKEREGRGLKTFLLTQLDHLEKLLTSIAKTSAQTSQKKVRNQKEKLTKLRQGLTIDNNRLEHELVLLSDRLDVTEELQRLKEHLGRYRDLVHTKGEVGKKLDFYCQEILRELNTIGSKLQGAELTENIVHAKACVEKMREQVQNVE